MTPFRASLKEVWNRLTWPDLVSTAVAAGRSEEHTSELQSRLHLVCRLLLEKKKNPMSHTSSAISSRDTTSPDECARSASRRNSLVLRFRGTPPRSAR